MESVSDMAGAGADLKKARRKVIHADPIKLDRLPPHDTEMERGILGCILLSPNDCMGEVVEKSKDGKELFYDLRHQAVFEALAAMHERRKPINVITLQQRLKDKGLLEQVGGIAYLMQLQDAVPSAANLSYYLDIVREKFLLRRAVQVCTETVGKIYDYTGEVDALLDEVERDILAIRGNAKSEQSGVEELVLDAFDEVQRRIKSKGAIIGLPTGLPNLDKLTDGLHKSEMVVVAAQPSRGKSVLACGIVIHNALRGVPGVIFTAEMRPVQIILRAMCSEARVNARHIGEQVEFDRMSAAGGRLAAAPLYIVMCAGWSIQQVVAVARRLHQRHGLGIAAVDYMQKLTAPGENEERKMAGVSLGIKNMCMELDIPVLAVSQVTKKDGGQFAMKHATAITEDADSLWRLENSGDWETVGQKVNLLVEKAKEGETGRVELMLLKPFTRFESAAKVEDKDVPEGIE